MSMTITVDPTGMTQAQREAVAGFILAYPKSATKSLGEINISLDAQPVRIDALRDASDDTGVFNAAEIAGAAADAEATRMPAPADNSPEMAFGSAAVAVPLPLGAVVAPPAPPAPQAAGVIEQPTAPVSPAPVTATPSVAVDKDGLPWDARIHSSNRATIADGTWRKKRNVEPATVAAVEAELRSVMAAPAPSLVQQAFATGAAAPLAAPSAPATTPTAGVASSVAPVPAPPAPVVTPPAPVVTPPAPAVTPPPSAPSVDLSAFVTLVGRASAALQAGKLSQAEIAEACAAAGIPALPMLANRPDLVPAVAADIDARIAAKG